MIKVIIVKIIIAIEFFKSTWKVVNGADERLTDYELIVKLIHNSYIPDEPLIAMVDLYLNPIQSWEKKRLIEFAINNKRFLFYLYLQNYAH